MLEMDQKTKANVQVSNFIEEPEEVVYYEESFPGEFDDGVVVDYEEASFDEQVVMLGFPAFRIKFPYSKNSFFCNLSF